MSATGMMLVIHESSFPSMNDFSWIDPMGITTWNFARKPCKAKALQVITHVAPVQTIHDMIQQAKRIYFSSTSSDRVWEKRHLLHWLSCVWTVAVTSFPPGALEDAASHPRSKTDETQFLWTHTLAITIPWSWLVRSTLRSGAYEYIMCESRWLWVHVLPPRVSLYLLFRVEVTVWNMILI